MSRRRLELDDHTTFIGILLGLVAGALCTGMRISKCGAVRRRDLAQFGAGSIELEIDASISEAKRRAKERQEGD